MRGCVHDQRCGFSRDCQYVQCSKNICCHCVMSSADQGVGAQQAGKVKDDFAAGRCCPNCSEVSDVAAVVSAGATFESPGVRLRYDIQHAHRNLIAKQQIDEMTANEASAASN